MATPNTPLVLDKFDPNKLTLDEIALFVSPEEIGVFRWAWGLRGFLRKYSQWPEAEIGKIELGELQAIAEQLKPAIEAALVPLGSSPS